jgi:hypothetical protein
MSYDAATTGKGGVNTIAVYPIINSASAIDKAFARPHLLDIELMKNAAVTKPRALQTKMVDTVP